MNRRVGPPTGFRGAFLTDPAVRAAYSEGAGPLRILPAAVAIPRDTRDLAVLAAAARDGGYPLVPRGAGSGMPGGNVGPGVVVDLQQFDRGVTLRSDGTVLAGASATWEDVDRAAATRGLRLGPDPSSGAFCTVGGMVATNAAGPRSLQAGSVRPWVVAAEVVTADGEVGWLTRGGSPPPVPDGMPGGELAAIRRFDSTARPAVAAAAEQVSRQYPRTNKNSSGYALDEFLRTGDVLDLVVGSEGTLAVVTRVVFRLEARPEGVAGFVAAVDDLAALADVVARLRSFEPAAVEMLDHTLLAVAGSAVPGDLADADAVLLVQFENPTRDAAVGAMQEAAAAAAPSARLHRTATSASALEDLWTIRHAASPALASLPPTRRSLQIVEDGCVPLEVLGSYVSGVRRAAREAGIEIAAFGHAGDGHLHVNALVDTGDPRMTGRVRQLYDAVSGLVVDLGGTPSGEHGDGRLRAELVERLYGPAVFDLLRGVRTAFDPEAVLNPGAVLPDGGLSPLSCLKVGPGAPPVPPAIARRLGEVERSAGWGRPKLDLVGIPGRGGPTPPERR